MNMALSAYLFVPIMLSFLYYKHIAVTWSYMGFTDLELTTKIVNTIIAAVTIIIMGYQIKKTAQIYPSDILLLIFASTSGASFIFMCRNNETAYAMYVAGVIALAFTLGRTKLVGLINIKTPILKVLKSKRLMRLITYIILLTVLITAISGYSGISGFSSDSSSRIFNTDSVALRGRLSKLGTIGSYSLFILRYLLGPILIKYMLETRKYVQLVLLVILYFMIATIGATKVDLAIPIIVITIYITEKWLSKGSLEERILVPLGIIITVLTVYIEIGWNQSLVSMAAMRGLFIQGVIAHNYRDFFETNSLMYLSHMSILSSWYPYTEPIGRIIGNIYGGGRVNSHWISTEGIAGFGTTWGPIIAGIIVGLVFSRLNNLVRGYKMTYKGLMILYPLSIPFCDTPFSVSLVSGGIIVYYLTAKVYPGLLGYENDKHNLKQYDGE